MKLHQGSDVPALDLGNLEFIDQAFDAVDARGFNLQRRVFEGCKFTKCVFAEADFSKARFIDCEFQDCDLSNMQLRGGSLRDVTFTNSKLVGISWAQATSVVHLNFEKCTLSYGVFSGLDLRKSTFRECIAKETDFADSNLSEANFRGTDLIGARFANTNLIKADLRSAINYSIRPLENKISKARFSLPEATFLLHGLGIVLEE